jgi:hydrogenase expression/formation protein HypC
MCLAVPGKIIGILNDDSLQRSGRVDFGGVVKDVNLSLVPDARVDDYVIVHVGFALHTIDEREAKKIFEYLHEIGDVDVGQEAK